MIKTEECNDLLGSVQCLGFTKQVGMCIVCAKLYYGSIICTVICNDLLFTIHIQVSSTLAASYVLGITAYIHQQLPKCYTLHKWTVKSPSKLRMLGISSQNLMDFSWSLLVCEPGMSQLIGWLVTAACYIWCSRIVALVLPGWIKPNNQYYMTFFEMCDSVHIYMHVHP